MRSSTLENVEARLLFLRLLKSMLLLRGRELCSESLIFEPTREAEPARCRPFIPLKIELKDGDYEVFESGEIG